MATSIESVFTPEELATLKVLPQVLEAKSRIDASTQPFAMVYFSIPLNDTLRQRLQERLGVSLSGLSELPMRWMKGDMHSHIDTGATFQNTYLVYLNTTDGALIVDSQSYPIQENTAYVFSEGLRHETVGTGLSSRLLVGPMCDTGLPVGSAISYFPTQADALAYTNTLGYGGYTVGTIDGGDLLGITSWRLASNSSGTSSQLLVYPNGSVLNGDGNYFLYPAIPCFLEGSKLLCQVDGKEEWKPIETIQKGTLVKTRLDGFKKVEYIGYGTIHNPDNEERIEERLYICKKEEYPELTDDLIITGCHSILVDDITQEQRDSTIKILGRIFVTDKKYRLMACVDERTKPWQSPGEHKIWHLALEHEDPRMNYGVYANGGLLVETCSKNFITNKGNMTLL